MELGYLEQRRRAHPDGIWSAIALSQSCRPAVQCTPESSYPTNDQVAQHSIVDKALLISLWEWSSADKGSDAIGLSVLPVYPIHSKVLICIIPSSIQRCGRHMFLSDRPISTPIVKTYASYRICFLGGFIPLVVGPLDYLDSQTRNR